MKRFVSVFCITGLMLAFPAVSLLAQQSTPSTPAALSGQVAGHVFCQDTGLPARFAGVQLLAEKPSSTPLLDPASLGKNPDLGKVMAQAMAAVMKGSNLSTVTGIDGSFSLDKVPPGTYYVIPQLPGYRSPLGSFSMMERMKADQATVAAVESLAEKIVVQPGASTSLNIELQRGATLSGTVAYDDGSPAPGVTPALLVQDKDGKWKELSMTLLPSVTDDRGQFRFYGLAAGKYAVKATLPVTQATAGLGASSVSLHMNLGDALVVYQGGALREKDVKPIELVDGDQRDGVEVVFPINGLHAISGSVAAKSDNHPVNSGTIALEDPDTKAPVRTTTIGEDGTFRLNYVPDGGYILKVSTAADTEQNSGDAPAANDLGRMLSSKTVRSYGSIELALTVKDGDANGIVLQVPDEKQ
jgi:hypothetical protein